MNPGHKYKSHNVFSLGSTYHLAALCATAGLKRILVSSDTILIDISYHTSNIQRKDGSICRNRGRV